MRKQNTLPLLILFASFLLLLSIPRHTAENIRGSIMGALTPFWGYLSSSKDTLFGLANKKGDEIEVSHSEKLQLKLENQLLRIEMHRLQELLQQEFYLHQDLNRKELTPSLKLAAAKKQKHQQDLNRILQLRLQSIPGHVIFRSPAAWHSSLWIDVGESANTKLGRTAIGKNSPVVVGTSLVGVIDYVGEHQSRVRLITDSGLHPSVRAARGLPRNRWLADELNIFLDVLMNRDDLFDKISDKEELIQRLEQLQISLADTQESWYLAKGELHGSSSPLWRTQGNVLKGTGFNYDFSDTEGAARDLRSGIPYDSKSQELPPLSMLKEHDLLITTGMDGVFPPGLNVAEVTKILPLREGDYFYELEAVPTAGNFDDLSLIFVLPPQGFDSNQF